jgi:hypothetical protein
MGSLARSGASYQTNVILLCIEIFRSPEMLIAGGAARRKVGAYRCNSTLIAINRKC